MKTTYRILWGMMSILVVISAACSPGAVPPVSPAPSVVASASAGAPSEAPTQTASVLPADVHGPAFAAFQPVAVNLP
ncbi:MAG: hypothetical protein ACM3XO_15305, partial [Bacteroidota bacterium]